MMKKGNTASSRTSARLSFLIVGLVGLFFGSTIASAQGNAVSYEALVTNSTGLLYYRPMQEGTGTGLIARTGGVNLAMTGGTSWTGGYFTGSSAFYADGAQNSFARSLAPLTAVSGRNNIVVEFLLNLPNGNDYGMVLEHGTSYAENGDFLFSREVSTNMNILANVGNRRYVQQSSFSIGDWHHIVLVMDTSIQPNNLTAYFDGVKQTNIIESQNGTIGTFIAKYLTLFQRTNGNGAVTNVSLQGAMSHLAIYSDLSEDEIIVHSAEAGFSPSLPPVDGMKKYIILSGDLRDNGYDNINTPRQSPLAQFKFITNSTGIEVCASKTTAYWSEMGIGVIIDGAQQPQLNHSLFGVSSTCVPLALNGETHTIELISSPQGTAGSLPSKGIFLDGVNYASGADFSVIAPTLQPNRVVIYGDSIAAGGNAPSAVYNGFSSLLRYEYGQSIMSETYGYRALKDDADTAPKLSNFINRFISYAPKFIWLAIGTNDFGVYHRDTTAFGNAYSGLVDGLIAGLPNTKIICMTPILRVGETSGAGIDLYREKIVEACSGKQNTIIVNGLNILYPALGDYLSPGDSVHPGITGHQHYANYIAPFLLDTTYTITGPTTGNTNTTTSSFILAMNQLSGYTQPTFASGQTITLSVATGTLQVNVAGTVNGNATSTVLVTPNYGETGFTFTYTANTTTGVINITSTNGQQRNNPIPMSIIITDPNSPSIPSTPTVPTTPTYAGGGGGGISLVKDSCPNGDLSPSYYDKTCGTTANLTEEVAKKVNLLRPVIKLIYLTATEEQKTFVHNLITSCSEANKNEIIKLACQELIEHRDF